MMANLIRWSVKNRFFVFLAVLALAAVGVWAVRTTPVDALPDLSDTQVIVRTSYPGQAPRIVEDQVTYPLTTTMLSVPGAETVRGYSFLGDSFVYIIFKEGTDLYWARSRVLEYLSQVQSRLPDSAQVRRSAPTRPGWAGSMNTPWWTGPAVMIWRSFEASRIGSCATNSRPYRACRKSRPIGGMVRRVSGSCSIPINMAAFGVHPGRRSSQAICSAANGEARRLGRWN